MFEIIYFQSKNIPVSIYCYDLLGNGNNQLITGWTNGKIDCRDVKSGEVLFKDNIGHPIAGIVEADYRGSGKSDLICVSIEGESKFHFVFIIIGNAINTCCLLLYQIQEIRNNNLINNIISLT